MVNHEYNNIKENFVNKLKYEEYVGIETDQEFYYIAGLCTRYMATKYIKIFRNLRENQVVKFVLTSNNSNKLKENLKTMLIGKCNNIIYLDKDKKFNNAFAMLMGYIPDNEKINKEFLQLGYLESNIL